MTHISSIGAGIFSDLSYSGVGAETEITAVPATEQGWKDAFAQEVSNGTVATAGAPLEFRRIKDIREFPQMGTPPNIVNIPTFGYKTSKQVQGQADAPNFEVTLNYVPVDWQNTANYHGNLIGNGKLYLFRFTLLNTPSTGSTANTAYASLAAGLGTVQNSQYFWMGKFEALQINPQLSDANTAVLTISIQSEFLGPYTNT